MGLASMPGMPALSEHIYFATLEAFYTTDFYERFIF